MDLKDYQESNRLNLSGFINLNKAISYNNFVEKYVNSGEYEIYTEKSIGEFKKAFSNELVKGQYGADELKMTQKELSKLERVEFQSGDTTVGVFVKSLKKEEEETGEELEKGMVTESFGSYSNNKLSFKKTGKEINEQITKILLPLLEAQKVQLESDLTSVAKDITEDPDDFIGEWAYRGFAKVLPKVARYSWNKCENEYDQISRRTPEPSEEQKLMRKYNSIAENLVSTMADIQYSGLLARNVEDSKSYELTSDQVLALQF